MEERGTGHRGSRDLTDQIRTASAGLFHNLLREDPLFSFPGPLIAPKQCTFQCSYYKSFPLKFPIFSICHLCTLAFRQVGSSVPHTAQISIQRRQKCRGSKVTAGTFRLCSLLLHSIMQIIFPHRERKRHSLMSGITFSPSNQCCFLTRIQHLHRHLDTNQEKFTGEQKTRQIFFFF